MDLGTSVELMWGLGLAEDEATLLQSLAGDEYQLRNWPLSALPNPADMQGESPALAWISADAWDDLPAKHRTALQEWDAPLRILILDEKATDLCYEEVAEQGFLTTIRCPLRREAVQDVLFRAREIRTMYTDVISMTKEILLERELLARKTDQLQFLNRILTRASESLDPRTIMNRAREDMDMLFPVQAVQALFWRETAAGPEAELYLSPGLSAESRRHWCAYLLEQAAPIIGREVRSYTIVPLETRSQGQEGDIGGPQPAAVVAMPLRTGLTPFGLLALSSKEPVSLARDQVQTITAAVQHLALALKNALLYREVQTMADFDGLTRIHNRQSFDRRLREELARHKRYQQPISLLMLDLDHFKRINDSFGHEAGDMVLRELGRILSESMRETDIAARYGGEEFVVILPHTDESNAHTLAQRLRAAICGKIFHFHGQTFQVTVSIGISSIDAASVDLDTNLVREADQALYLAKRNGRNMVCRQADEDSLQAAGN
ncbi:GGDEF domain-containing protein [Desulfocurvibacter africanus]|uniref:GGDEF domain-containing protein n=1 Tax=Desulfocurvibacter africanus TaxID=873 RepID=UPI002FDAAC49